MCAVAQLVDSGGDLVLQREVQYIEGGQVALDKAYRVGHELGPWPEVAQTGKSPYRKWRRRDVAQTRRSTDTT